MKISLGGGGGAGIGEGVVLFVDVWVVDAECAAKGLVMEEKDVEVDVVSGCGCCSWVIMSACAS
jgi:hypothetical protein